MKRSDKEALSEKIFDTIKSVIINFEKDHDVYIDWESTIKINGENFYDFKIGVK